VADDVGFAACGFHGLEGFECGGVGFELGGHVGPIYADMPGHVLLEAGFNRLLKYLPTQSTPRWRDALSA
jgi:hypothetical protein